MVVCVPTDDGRYVKVGHFGDAKYYYHFLFDGSSWKLVRKIVNPYTGQHVLNDYEESEKRGKIYEMNKECDYIVAVAFGRGGQRFMEERGLNVVKVRPKTTLEDALRNVEEVIKESSTSGLGNGG